MAKPIPKTIAGVPTPVVIVGGVAVLAYFYLRHSAATASPTSASPGGPMGIRRVRGMPGKRGPRGKPGKTIRQVVLICPPGYHKVNKRCVKNHHKPKHPAHKFMARQPG